MNSNARKIWFAVFLLIILCSTASASDLVDAIVKPMTETICSIFDVMANIAGALGALIITISSLKWVGSAEDPGARKQAKDTITNVIVGMLLIVVARSIVEMITGESNICPDTTITSDLDT